MTGVLLAIAAFVIVGLALMLVGASPLVSVLVLVIVALVVVLIAILAFVARIELFGP